MIIELTSTEIWWIRQAVQADRREAIRRAINGGEKAAEWNRIADRYSVIDDKLKRYQQLLK